MLALLAAVIRRAAKGVKHASGGISDAMKRFRNGTSKPPSAVWLHANKWLSRNCTKHQVRCDYMETFPSDSDSQPSPEQPTILLTPNSESRVELWQQTGGFPYPDLHVFPQPPIQEYSRNELRLIEHLSAISNDLLMNGTSSLTIWTQKLPK